MVIVLTRGRLGCGKDILMFACQRTFFISILRELPTRVSSAPYIGATCLLHWCELGGPPFLQWFKGCLCFYVYGCRKNTRRSTRVVPVRPRANGTNTKGVVSHFAPEREWVRPALTSLRPLYFRRTCPHISGYGFVGMGVKASCRDCRRRREG